MFVTNTLLDPRIDQVSPDERREFPWGLWRDQLEYAVTSETPVIVQVMKGRGLDLSDFCGPDDLPKFPVIIDQVV